MMKNQRGILHSRIFKVIILMMFIILGLAVRFDFYYDLNDDTAIKDILSGAYTGTPSGYSIQMLYPLGAFIALLYRAIPGVSWYGLFLCTCQFGAMTLIAYRITGLIEEEKKQIIALIVSVIIMLGLLFEQYVIIQYSVTSGICMMAAIFLYATSKSPKLKDNIIPILLVVLSFQIRTELCLMLMPFLLLAGFAKWMLDLKNTKYYIAVIATAIIGMALFYTADIASVKMNENSLEWQEFRQLFDDRTKLYDFYELPDYDSNVAFFEGIGMTRESYGLLKNYNYSLDENITADTFRKIADYQEILAKEGKNNLKVTKLPFGKKLITKNTIKEAIWLYKQQILHPTLLSGVVVLVYIGYFLLSSMKKRSGCIWKFLLLIGCRSSIWIYLFMVDRMVPRITFPLYVSEVALLLSWTIYDQLYVDIKEKKLPKVYYGLIVLYAIVLLVPSVKTTVNNYEARETTNPRWERLMEYCRNHPLNYYLIDVYSSTSYNGVPYSEKMFVDVDNSYKNFDICGGWIAKSPLENTKLELVGINSIEKAFFSENVYFIVSQEKTEDINIEWIKKYYENKGKNIKIKKIDDITHNGIGFIVYKLEEV